MKRNLLVLLSLTTVLFLIYQLIILTSVDLNSNLAKEKIEDYETKEKNDIDYVLEFPATCFAPGTDPSVIEDYYNYKFSKSNSIGLTQDDILNKFNILNRWSGTAINGGGLGQGDPTVLTWSYVDDGTPIGNGGCGVPGESSDNSDVIAFFNGLYGPPTIPGDYTTAPWHNIFVDMFNSWSEVGGLSFIYEPNDDGAAVVTSQGQLGVRGDIRISGHQVDGNSGVLACNYFPNNGDMIIDTADSFFTNNPGTANDPFLGLVNVLTHEVGHGLGIAHVCPVNQTKLMEPIVSFAFEGQQEDDILAVNRSYGDVEGDNNTFSTATFLGDSSSPALYNKSQRSIDDVNDIDYYSFTINETSTVNIQLNPTGTTYLDGVQLPTGACSDGSNFNALTVSDLMVELLDQDGSSVVSKADFNGPGAQESILASITNPGTYYVRVQQEGDAVNNVQMYDLSVSLGECSNASIPTNLQVSSITGVTAVINWDAIDFPIFDLRYREVGTTTWIVISDIVTLNQPLTNLTFLTEYEVQVRSKCSGGSPTSYSSSLFFTTTGLTYCDSEGESIINEYILNLNFASIDNNSFDSNSGYSDFTNISTDVVVGQDYPITITPFWPAFPNTFPEGYAAWIDFNQNGSFEDSGELVFSQTPTQNTSVSGVVNIPLTALLGPTRMRVSMKFDDTPDSCESFDFGEVEDYTINIIDPNVGVDEQNFGAGFTLYPNPTNGGIFSIKTPNLNGKVNLEIFSLLGQQISVQELSVKGQQVDVNAQDLSTGIYVVKLSQGNQSFITKLIVE